MSTHAIQITRTANEGTVTVPEGAAVVLNHGMAQVIVNVPADQVRHLVAPERVPAEA